MRTGSKCCKHDANSSEASNNVRGNEKEQFPPGVSVRCSSGISGYFFYSVSVCINHIYSITRLFWSVICLLVFTFPVSLDERTVVDVQSAEGSSSRRTLHPPHVYRGRPDNEIRLQLPPSRRSSRTYLCCTDAPRPRGGILNRLLSTDQQELWYVVQNGRRCKTGVYSPSFFYKQCYVVRWTPSSLLQVWCRAVWDVSSCDYELWRQADCEILIMRPILECASIPDLHGFDHDIQLRGRTPGNPADSLHCTKLHTRKCRWSAAALISAVFSLEFCSRFSQCFYKWTCFINGSDTCHRCCPAVWEKPRHDWSKLCGVHFYFSHFSCF